MTTEYNEFDNCDMDDDERHGLAYSAAMQSEAQTLRYD